MFALNKKLEVNLKNCMSSKCKKDYRVIIKYKNFKDKIIKKIPSYKGSVIRHVHHCNIISAKLNSKGINRLLEYPEVEYICFDEYAFLCGMSVPTANQVRLSNNTSFTGKGIGIGVVDSGVFPHPDLLSPYNRIASFVDLINNLNYPYDDNGHGTCICGVIAGNGNRSNNMYRGVATQSTIHCYKAFDKLGKGFFSDILCAIESLINESQKYNIKVLCLPFELLYYNSFLQSCFNSMLHLAVSKKITPVVPSGSNKNYEGSLTGIALCEDCITVSGLNTSSKLEPYIYSSAGTSKKDDLKPDLSAACVDIVSLNCNTNYISEKNGIKLFPNKLDRSYKSFSGTSLAAAYICGLCALLYEDNPNLTFHDVLSLLKVSCESLDMPKGYQGEGKVNINKILK